MPLKPLSPKLQIIIAHEVGHLLGLGHTQYEPSLMYYSIGEKKYLRLSQDDMDGLSFLYPRNELGGDGLFGCGTLENQKLRNQRTEPRSNWGLWFEFAILCAIVIVGARRYRVQQPISD